MIQRLASLGRFVPAALQAGADVFVSTVFWADSRVNAWLTPAWSGWTPACEHTSEPLPTREDAGNAVLRVPSASPTSTSRLVLSWPEIEVVHGCPGPGEGVTPCCQRTPFELALDDRMTTVPAEVTCGRPEGAWS